MTSYPINGGQRAGTTIFEVIVAVMLLSAGLAITGQVIHTASLLRRENERRQCALQEAVNAFQQLRAKPWSELSAEEPPRLSLSSAGQRQLPQAKLTLHIVDDDQADARQFVVEVNWRLRSGQSASPVRLSGWRFAGEDQP
jgi:Tfp pilus assembly protein PilV